MLGVDVAETALAIARAKADDRGIEVEFAAADAFQLEHLGRRFSTVLDCGLFHTFAGDERPGYVASLASVTEHGGTLYGPAPRQAGRADGGVRPRHRVERRRHRTGPGSDEIPRRRRTGLVRDDQTGLVVASVSSPGDVRYRIIETMAAPKPAAALASRGASQPRR